MLLKYIWNCMFLVTFLPVANMDEFNLNIFNSDCCLQRHLLNGYQCFYYIKYFLKRSYFFGLKYAGCNLKVWYKCKGELHVQKWRRMLTWTFLSHSLLLPLKILRQHHAFVVLSRGWWDTKLRMFQIKSPVLSYSVTDRHILIPI